jgi:hypothetical protein
MAIQLNGDSGITTPTYGGTITAEYSVPVTSMKNRIINGSMVIDQRNAGASVTPTNGSYSLDRWGAFATVASKYTVQQNAGSVTPPAGFKNYLGVTSSSAYSVGAGDVFSIFQCIEGFNTADLNWGTANASSVTVSFWVRSSLTGTFGGAIINAAETRSYPFTYTISAANTWEQKTVTIAGDTTGTWQNGNLTGMRVLFNLGTGATFSGTAGAWASSTYYSATGATSVVGTNGATFYITGVQLEKGSTATSFDYRPYGTELALCQRYYQALGRGLLGYWGDATSIVLPFVFPVEMRAAPTAAVLKSDMNISDGSGGRIGSPASISATNTNSSKSLTLTVVGFSGATAYRPASANNDNVNLFSFSSEL